MNQKTIPSKETVSAVIFEGGKAVSSVEKDLQLVRHALLLDNIEKLKESPYIGDIYLLTNYPELVKEGNALGIHSILNNTSPQEFSFGKELQKIISENSLKHIFYLGGAGAPLLSQKDINYICRQILSRDRVILTNNSQSADMVAFTPASLLLEVAPPFMDNTLAVDLQEGTGITQELIPATLGVVFDLDTPTELMVLRVTSFVGPRGKEALAKFSLDLNRISKARSALAGDYEEILLLGRVGAPIISRMNLNLKARLRVFSEERGMKALGRIKNKEVVSLMGFFLEEVGVKGFFDYISKIAACAFIDSRVIFSHKKLDPSDSDRFNSDLGRWKEVKDPFVREFTQAAVEAPIPIILGGHSLVLGGLWALVEDIGPQY